MTITKVVTCYVEERQLRMPVLRTLGSCIHSLSGCYGLIYADLPNPSRKDEQWKITLCLTICYSETQSLQTPLIHTQLIVTWTQYTLTTKNHQTFEETLTWKLNIKQPKNIGYSQKQRRVYQGFSFFFSYFLIFWKVDFLFLFLLLYSFTFHSLLTTFLIQLNLFVSFSFLNT